LANGWTYLLPLINDRAETGDPVRVADNRFSTQYIRLQHQPDRMTMALRSKRLTWLCTATVALLLAACASGNGPKTVVQTAPVEQPQTVAQVPVAVPTPVATPVPEPVAPRPAQISTQLRVAVLVPMTGPSARVGQAIANAANMALLDLNTSRIKLKIYNTESGAAAAASDAIGDGAKVILGPLFAADVRAVQGVAREAGVPVITFSNDASVAQAGTYILGYQPAQEIARVVSYARSRGITRFGALVPQGRYGEISAKALSIAVAGQGQVSAIESYPRDRQKLFAPVRRVSNYEARLRAARAQAGAATSTNVRLPPPPFEALLVADGGGMLRSLLPVLKDAGVESPRVRFLGTGLWSAEPDLAREPALVGAWFGAVPDAEFNNMAKRFRGQFGYQPPRLASLGYDGVLLVSAAARKWSPGMNFPSSVLSDPAGYIGIDGAMRFSGSGIAIRGMQVQEILPDGKIRTVAAAAGRFN
jgi:branched-chain amino acid transport system substrate-binding protein